MSRKINNLETGAYLKAAESYCLFIKADGKFDMKTRPVKYFEPMLQANGWCRIHRSYFVNPHFVEHISDDRNSIFLQNGTELPISRRNKKSVSKWLSVTFYNQITQ